MSKITIDTFFKRTKSNLESGFTITEAILAIFIVSLVSFLAIDTLGLKRKSSMSARVAQQIVAVKTSFQYLLRHPGVWQATILGNAGMACLANGTDCTGRGGTFNVYDNDGSGIYRPLAQTSIGLNLSGQECTTYVPVGSPGDPTCPIRLNLIWQPLCPGVGLCINPMVRILGVIVPNTPQLQFAMGLSQLNFVILR